MPEKHYYEQINYTTSYFLPYLYTYISNFDGKEILEIGCAEGGLLKVLSEKGANVTGIEISKPRVDLALEKNPSLNIILGDITATDLPHKLNKKFDLIVMREVIEHIHKKDETFRNISILLKKDGFLFISFPPKWSPFAGHQQIAKNFLRYIPYLHLLPKNLLYSIAKVVGESREYVDEIKLHFSTGCTINTFEILSRKYQLTPIIKEFFLFRPVYLQRFGLPKLKLPNIPLIREMITLGCESLLKKTF
ncbi:MAG: class I SAM-dependent methyltransferase [Melioribacteraceae bacterium]|jgi:SAM-dependent methyltransferase|nr:class I SAM-dependent methyltransferase [Melioribacteraceae bacterium]